MNSSNALVARTPSAGQAPPPAGSRVYELTDWGRELEDIVISLGRWAARSPSQPQDAPMGVDSIVLALRALFDSDAAKGLCASYELRLGEDRFRIAVSDDAIEVARVGADQADATVETDPGTLDAVLWDGRPLADAQRSGEMRIEGDKAAVERLVRLFPMPEPIAPGAAP
jgi:alkyl sulfatase BDS1-like metallo-beta-lactamase superfamily hydrolase